MNVAIIIPCYNEGERLDINKFEAYLLNNTHIHFYFVDDGSTDNTIHIIKKLITKYQRYVTLLKNDFNIGKAESVRLGIIESLNNNHDIIGYLDADLAAPIEEIDCLLNICQTNVIKEVVFASRIQLISNEIKRKYFRHFIGRIFATCVSLLMNIRIYDTQCGAKIFSRKICEEIFSEEFISPWLFDVEIFARLVKKYGIQKTIEISFENPISKWVDVKGSKIDPYYYFKAPFELIKIFRHYKLG